MCAGSGLRMLVEEELYWLEANWRVTRGHLMRILLQGSPSDDEPDLLGDIVDEIAAGGLSAPTWDAFVEDRLSAIHRARLAAARRKASGPHPLAEMYDVAIDLFADPTPLRQELEQAGGRLGGEAATAVKVTALRRGLVRMRHRRSATSEHRGKTWSRLDAISRSLFQNRHALGGRCDKAHFIELAEHISSDWAHDKNLPRTASTIEGYFEEYCEECRRHVEVEEAERGVDFTSPGDIASLPDLASRGDYLEVCMEGLDATRRRYVEAKFRIGPIAPLNVSTFCAQEQIERTRFYRVVEQALLDLEACLRSKVEGEAR